MAAIESLLPEGAIGVFDSGFGGLTVLKSMVKKLPEESYIYLGDSARLPYGTKSRKTIRQYVEQNINFLKNLKVKAIIVACNSASSALNHDDDFGLPVLNVIDPGAAQAVNVSTTGAIGIIGTRATIAQQSYVHAIHQLSANKRVYQQACPLFVPLVEEGWEDDPLTNLIVHRYLNPLLAQGIDTLVLGCTHYPVLKAAIQKVTRGSVSLVDSADSIAESVFQMITQEKIMRNSSDEPRIEILATDLASSFQEVAHRILHPLKISNFHHVSISSL